MKNCLSSGSKTASAAIKAGAGFLHGIMIANDGTNAITLNIYDNDDAASGTKLIPETIITASATDRFKQITFNNPVIAIDGIYVSVSVAGGGSCAYVAYFK